MALTFLKYHIYYHMIFDNDHILINMIIDNTRKISIGVGQKMDDFGYDLHPTLPQLGSEKIAVLDVQGDLLNHYRQVLCDQKSEQRADRKRQPE